MMKIEIENMTNQIPLGKQLKYALQEKEVLQEELKDVGAHFDRAAEQVSELEFLLAESIKMVEELQLKQEWMGLMAMKAYEEGYFQEASANIS